jgi:D-lactate dehydrogenase (cytochrome)
MCAMVTFSSVETSILDKLKALVGSDYISTGKSVLNLHSKDQSFHEPHLPEVVVWATEAQQVADILKLANEHKIPVTPWGVGSSLEGNPIPLHGGILLSFAKMDKVIEVHADDFQVTVQPGKAHQDLNKELGRYGLFFPPDPGANATIGGMLANNAAGIRTVKYGASKDNVLAMQVALADGRLIRVGSRSIKQSAGYNLMQLFVGSEGTLGIITEATLKLAPIPEHRTTMVASFLSIENAVEAVVAVRGSGIDVAALEFFDTAAAKTLASRMGVEANPTLLMEVYNAHQAAQEADIAIVRDIVEELGANFVAIADPSQQSAIWEQRHKAYETMLHTYPQHHFFVMDVAVPISIYPEIILYSREQLAIHNLEIAFLLGHAGDGNIHVTMAYQNDDELKKVKAINEAIVKKAIALDGTATGEHGVGIGKKAYMRAEHGEAVEVMRMMKNTLDPQGILNPGKVLPE